MDKRREIVITIDQNLITKMARQAIYTEYLPPLQPLAAALASGGVKKRGSCGSCSGSTYSVSVSQSLYDRTKRDLATFLGSNAAAADKLKRMLKVHVLRIKYVKSNGAAAVIKKV